jgi:hypothetical protein|tara:strand:+ start:77 stop:253 length:177 start_codon:yes stop_codon:yes gene_type:complete
MVKVKIMYKSGNITESDINMTPEELSKKLKEGHIDINDKTFSMIRWSEVEAIVPDTQD